MFLINYIKNNNLYRKVYIKQFNESDKKVIFILQNMTNLRNI